MSSGRGAPSWLGGVGQPLQLLAQRGLGARKQLGGRERTSARLPPPQAGVARQHEVQQLVAESQHGCASGESRRKDKRGGEGRREDESDNQ